MGDKNLNLLGAKIQSWDTERVEELCDLIAELEFQCRELDDDPQSYFDVTSLPSAIEVPDRIADYPIWAIDKMGNCLVGAGADDIERLAEIMGSEKNDEM